MAVYRTRTALSIGTLPPSSLQCSTVQPDGFIHSTVNGHAGQFPSFALTNSALLSHLGHRSLLRLGSISRQKLPEAELLRQRKVVSQGHVERSCQSPVQSDGPICPPTSPGQTCFPTPLLCVRTLCSCPVTGGNWSRSMILMSISLIMHEVGTSFYVS